MDAYGPLDKAVVPVLAPATAFFAACMEHGFTDEGQEFAEWFLDAFDVDLED